MLGRSSCEFEVQARTSSKRITFPIRTNHRQFPFLVFLRVAVLHTQHTGVTLFMDILENIFVVHLSRAGLFTSRVIPDLEVGNLLPTLSHIRNNISFVSLHMVH